LDWAARESPRRSVGAAPGSAAGQDSHRLIPADEMFLQAYSVLAALMRTQMLLTAYPVEMKREAKLYGLQPVPWPTRHNQVPAAMHQALWGLLAGTGVEPPDQVLHAAQAVADAVRRDIWSAWIEFDSFRPARLTDPGAEAAQWRADHAGRRPTGYRRRPVHRPVSPSTSSSTATPTLDHPGSPDPPTRPAPPTTWGR